MQSRCKCQLKLVKGRIKYAQVMTACRAHQLDRALRLWPFALTSATNCTGGLVNPFVAILGLSI